MDGSGDCQSISVLQSESQTRGRRGEGREEREEEPEGRGGKVRKERGG